MNYWRENAGSRLWISETMVLLAYLMSWFPSSLKVVIGDFLWEEHSNDREFIFGLKAQSCERRVIIQLRPRTSQWFDFSEADCFCGKAACDFSLQALRQAAPVTSASADVVFGMLPGWTAAHWPTRLCCSTTSSIMKSVSVATGCLNFYFKFQRDYKTSETFQ